MASIVARRAFSTTVRRLQDHEKNELKKETKRNPELMILGGIMAMALGGAGYYFGRTPTGATSEAKVSVAEGSRPWESNTDAKYKYHPGGDTSKEPRDAPSALNVHVVPDVSLPKELHEKWNKWGKEGYP